MTSKRAAVTESSSDPAYSDSGGSDPPDGSASETSRGVWQAAMIGALAMWLVQPPMRWSLAVFLAPIPWLWLVHRPHWSKRQFAWLYAAGVLHWLLMAQGVRHPHIALKAGWLAMALYLGLYAPFFVVITRVLVHRRRWPLVWAAPTVWVALELLRGYLITGFSLGMLGHALAGWPVLIQSASLWGAYGISFLVMHAAAAFASLLFHFRQPKADASVLERRAAWMAMAAAVVLWAGAGGYAAWRLNDAANAAEPNDESMKVLMVQGKWDVFYTYDPKANQDMYLAYRRATWEALQEHPDTKLILWPESSLMAHLPADVVIDGPLVAPPDSGFTDKAYEAAVREGIGIHRDRLASLAISISNAAKARGFHMLVNGEAIHVRGSDETRHNAVLLIDDSGRIQDRYYKMHRVMIGEYLPGGDQFPWIYDWTPMQGGIRSGESPVSMNIGSLTFSPCICFESTVPHLIRSQLRTLRLAGKMPDVLLNPANDGWFHGSSILDLHGDCMVMRAIENGRPLLAAANGGITQWVDSRGRVQGALPRKTLDVLVAKVTKSSEVTFYQRMGDWLAWACAGLVVLSVFGISVFGRAPRLPSSPSSP